MKSKRPRSATELIGHHRAVAVVLLENVGVDAPALFGTPRAPADISSGRNRRSRDWCRSRPPAAGRRWPSGTSEWPCAYCFCAYQVVPRLLYPSRRFLIDFRGALDSSSRRPSDRPVACCGDADRVRVGRVARILRGELHVNQLGLMVFLPGHVDPRLELFFSLGESRLLRRLVGGRRLRRGELDACRGKQLEARKKQRRAAATMRDLSWRYDPPWRRSGSRTRRTLPRAIPDPSCCLQRYQKSARSRPGFFSWFRGAPDGGGAELSRAFLAGPRRRPPAARAASASCAGVIM